MLDDVKFVGTVVATSTNWPKHETSIGVSGSYQEVGEVEGQSLGKFIREVLMSYVKISRSETEKVEFRAYVTGCNTDWNNDITKVTFKVLSPDNSFEEKSAILGLWGNRADLVTVEVSSAQKSLL